MAYTYIKKTDSDLILGYADGSNNDGGEQIALSQLHVAYLSDNDGIPVCNIQRNGVTIATIDRYAFWQDGDYDNDLVQVYYDDMGIMKLFINMNELKLYLKLSIIEFKMHLVLLL